MKNCYTYTILTALLMCFAACNQTPGIAKKKKAKRQPINYANYVMEVITYKTKKGVPAAEYKRLDSVTQQRYTQKQVGYISKESGIDQQGNWLIVLAWDNVAHADADKQAFAKSTLWNETLKVIDTTTMSRKRFFVKDDHSSSLKDLKPYVIELATFKEKKQLKRDTFEKRDQQVEADYISRQTGYITRRVGMAANGERLMVIYWKTLADADAGMKEFLKDQSVADYAKMIDWKTVEMKRFQAVN
ncbi:MAG: hypothetical protein EOP42_31590 [Sphingobacteriaceae bacterium]|nr:MAG: hypothetical protein EOP42_31590 [Sphingobacteriaceae bacterium]